MNYNVDYFIRKFKAIPDDMFIAHCIDDHNGNHCANGWCGVTYPSEMFGDTRFYHVMKPNTTAESIALYRLFKALETKKINDGTEVPNYSFIAAEINNGNDKRFQQATPKKRILAALRVIKKMQQPIEPQRLPQFKEVTFTKLRKEIPVSAN